MGMLADKDIDNSISLLDGIFDRVFTVPVKNPRALSSEKLAEKFKSRYKNVFCFDSAEKAFDVAFNDARQDSGAIVVCGSLYLAGEIRPYIIDSVK